MAWDTKYSIEFSDILLVDWRIEIQEDGTFTESALQAMATPAIIEWFGGDDIFEQNILGSQLTMNIEAATDFVFEELFTSDDLKFKVLVYHGVTLYWSGFIQANTYQEPYDKAPFTVSLRAVDGLGLLKDYKFKDLLYTTRQITSVVIHDILDLVGITEFTEFVNLHESTMDSAVGDSMFDQSGIDPELFEGQTCYDALSSILFSLSAGIRQNKGVFEIFRFKELRDTTMYGRIYTTGAAKTSTTATPAQKLNRPGDASNLWDFEGGTMMIIPQIKLLNVNQDYKKRESILLNYNFEIGTFDAGAFDYWTSADSADVSPVATVDPGKLVGVVFNDTSSALDHSLTQTLPVNATTDDITMQFDVSGWGPDHSADIYAKVTNTDGVDYVYLTAAGAWNVTENEVFLVNQTFGGNVSYTTISFSLTGITYTGDLTVQIFNALSSGPSDVRGIFKEIRFFFINADGTAPEGVGYAMDNALYGQIVDKEYILGDGYGFDNDYLQYKGAFNVWSGTDPVATSLNWHTRGLTENAPLIQVIGEEMLAQYARQKQVVDLPLREMTAVTYLNLNGNIQDSYNQVSAVNRFFGAARAVYNIIDREWNLTLTEIL